MTYEVFDPGRTGDVVGLAPSHSPEHVDGAVARAKAAAVEWGAMSVEQRCALVTAAADAAATSGDPELLTRENGKVRAEAEFELATFGGVAHVFAAMAGEALAPRVAANGGAIYAEPYGVVAAILPFNWPAAVLASKIAPALIAGNAVVVKPPPTCPLTALALVEQLAAALPEGVVTAVNGPGTAVSEQLVAHRDVAMISLTGGTQTGRAVAAAAAPRLVPVLLELGGNDAGIVAPDLDATDALAARLLDAAFLTSGQVCMALKRLYVPDERLEDFVEALAAHADATVVTGYGLDPGVTVGPVHTAQAATRAESLLSAAQASGARVVRVGQCREEAGAGNYLHPAIVRASHTDPLVTEEQFAPVLPVVGYDSLDEAIDAANATPYGLGGSIWSADSALCDGVARRLEAGTVFRNNHGPAGLDPALPFGGWKQSGVGREYGVDGILSYTRTRALPPPASTP